MKIRKPVYIIIAYFLIISNILIGQTKTANLQNLSDFYFHKASVYFQDSLYDSAAVFYKKSIELKSELIENNNTKNSLLNTEESSNINANDFSINTENIQGGILKKSTQRNIIIVGGILILILLLHFFINLRNKSKTNKTLQNQNKQISNKSLEIEQQRESIININQELKKLSIAVNKTDNAILILSSTGNIEWINEGFTRLYGYTFEELIEQKGRNITEESANPKITEIFQKVITEKKSQIYETNIITKNNIEYRIHTTLTPVLNNKNEVEKLIAIDSDVTKQWKAENQLQELLVTKDKFFSIIAHDLKNPFNTLIGLAQLLVKGFDRMSTEKVKYFHKNLYQISKNGYELLINLLEWSRSQRGSIEFNPEKHDLNILTKETFSLFSTKASQKEIVLINNIGLNSFVFADKNMLKTIFRNLVSNALKFTDRGGVIEITEKKLEGFKEISVRDTGVGIDPENIKKLFKLDENYTTEGTEDESGTGLGLILCQEFVSKHKGEIRVESKLGFGSKFIFTLPVNN